MDAILRERRLTNHELATNDGYPEYRLVALLAEWEDNHQTVTPRWASNTFFAQRIFFIYTNEIFLF